ncbi:MAG: hypothetical protein CFE21_13140 [Bacteroidetes bacterium B1(2017)]|nr:MAG: hypothetical protein CFE21_13140 [Bacteroidetes bacterium B1(2017)]
MNDQIEEIREERQDKVSKIFNYFSAIMGVFYMVMGVVFYFFPFTESFDTWAKISISVVLVLYGGFRLKRALWS